jgi:LacI family transcriptional regulator
MYTQVVRIPSALRKLPLVLLNSYAKGRRLTTVLPDEIEAGRMVARELLRHGHRNEIVLVGESTSQAIAGQERLDGIRQELAAAGASPAALVDCLWWPPHSYRAVADYLAQGNRPSAFICLNDRVAFGVYQAVQELGWQVPRDVSVISFDDSDLAGWLRPALTSAAIPYFEMGRRSVELLLDLPDTPQVHRVPMRLHQRESVAAPAG